MGMKFIKAPKSDVVAYACKGEYSEDGLYKVVKYGKQWCAYFKADDMNSFGMSVAKYGDNSHGVDTIKAAKKQCGLHFKRYGVRPSPHKHLVYRKVNGIKTLTDVY